MDHCPFLRGSFLLAGGMVFGVICSAWGSGADPVSFRNEVMGVMSKAGCNAGACHGNASGKAGFKLSLRGQDPELDLIALTRDQFARRTNPIEPDRSLILLKGTTQIPHEGGRRFERSSEEYQILREWIAAGAEDDVGLAPRLSGLRVTPAEAVLIDPVKEVRLTVQARFSDGVEREISRLAVYEPANSLASVTHDGLVSRLGYGETTVLVRYLNIQVPVRLAFVRAQPGFVWSNPGTENYVDDHAQAKWRGLRMNPSGMCTDSEFIRRAYLDLLGLLPTAEAARAFVEETHSQKRSYLIDRLLERPEFADFWALKWSDLLRNEEKVLDRKGVENFHHWIRQSMAENKPLDVFVRELVSGRGSSYDRPAANYYRANRDAVSRAEATAQLFLGTQLRCAKCHNHPFDRWTQADYYDWADIFSRVKYKILENRRRDSNDQHEFVGEQVVWVAKEGGMTNPKTGQPAASRYLGMAAPAVLSESGAEDRLEALAEWMTSSENPFFARSQANRVWYHLMGRGIVDPIDDFRPTNPPSLPSLLEALAEDLKEHGFDQRHLIRVIMNSRAYQLASLPNESNREDEINFSHALIRRLSAEQLLDAQSQVTGVKPAFNGYPVGMRASQLSGVRAVRPRDRRLSGGDMFLEVFGKPPRLLTCDCERTGETSMAQAFNLISGPTIHELLTRPDNRLGELLGSGKSEEEMIEELYWTALTRAPGREELAVVVQVLRGAEDRRAALEDVTWALLNAKEFVLRK